MCACIHAGGRFGLQAGAALAGVRMKRMTGTQFIEMLKNAAESEYFLLAICAFLGHQANVGRLPPDLCRCLNSVPVSEINVDEKKAYCLLESFI